MREMQPRIWNKITNEIAMIDVIDWKEQYVIVSEDYVWNEDPETGEGECQVYFKDLELMWPTNLKDKNGKMIFESDIVQVPGAIPAQVYWDFGSWQMRNGSLTGGMLANYEPEDIDIIGNIQENPELLSTR